MGNGEPASVFFVEFGDAIAGGRTAGCESVSGPGFVSAGLAACGKGNGWSD